jgi:hypothetical protein
MLKVINSFRAQEMKAMNLLKKYRSILILKRFLVFISLIIAFSSCTSVLTGLGFIKKPKVLNLENMLEVGVSFGLAAENIFYYFPADTLNSNITYPYWPNKLIEEDGFAYIFDADGYLIEFESYCLGYPLRYLKGEKDSAMFKFHPDSSSVKVNIRDFLILEDWQLLSAKEGVSFGDFSSETLTLVLYWSRWQHYFTKRNIRDFTTINIPADSVRMIFINTDPIAEWYER